MLSANVLRLSSEEDEGNAAGSAKEESVRTSLRLLSQEEAASSEADGERERPHETSAKNPSPSVTEFTEALKMHF